LHTRQATDYYSFIADTIFSDFNAEAENYQKKQKKWWKRK